MGELKLLNFALSHGDRQIVYPTITLQSGFVYCLFGSNGAGKTSLVNYLFGAQDVTIANGAVRVDDMTINVSTSKHLGHLGYRLLPQRRPFTGNVSVPSMLRLLSGGPASLVSCQLPRSTFRRKDLRNRFSRLSGGQAKLAIVEAYAANASVSGIILDEPLAGLSSTTQYRLLDLLCGVARRKGLQIMITSVFGEPRDALNAAIKSGDVLLLPILAAYQNRQLKESPQ